MSSPANVEFQRPVVKNALQVDGNPEIDALLASVLDPESWSVQHARATPPHSSWSKPSLTI